MRNDLYFLKNINNPEYVDECDDAEKEAISKYMEEMQSGAANGEMDIHWQEMGKGYYVHEHMLKGAEDWSKEVLKYYVSELEEDINTWRNKGLGCHMIDVVEKYIQDNY